MKLTKLFQQVILENVLDSFKEKNVGKQLSNDTFNEIINVSKNKTNYILWLAKSVINGFIPSEDIYKFGDRIENDNEIRGYISIFDRYKNRYPYQDINKYNTQNEVDAFISKSIEIRESNVNIETLEGDKNNYVSTNDILKLKEVGIGFLGVKDGYQIFNVPSKLKTSDEAYKRYSAILGKCQGRNQGAIIEICTFKQKMFSNYLAKGGNFFVLYNLGDPKSPYQLHAESKEFKNKDNVSVDLEKMYDIINFIESKMGYKKDSLYIKMLDYEPTENGELINRKMEGIWIKKQSLHSEMDFTTNTDVDFIINITNFKNNKKDGEEIIKKYNEKKGIDYVVSKNNYKNGVLDGLNVNYYPNGQIEDETFYVNGNIDGQAKEYRIDGSIKKIENYKNGLRHGEQFKYNKFGKIVGLENYDNGKPIGEHIQYNNDGNVEQIITIIDDNQFELVKYFPNGEIAKEETYKNNEVIERKIYAYNGDLLEHVQIRNQITFIKKYNNGRLRQKYQLFNEKYWGPYEEYDKDSGQLIRSEFYNDYGQLITKK
jgi:antitoxin component YwqK of YwqJK toxin-antitoxin module